MRGRTIKNSFTFWVKEFSFIIKGYSRFFDDAVLVDKCKSFLVKISQQRNWFFFAIDGSYQAQYP